MQLKYVFSETGSGLRRNVSMTIALVVTISVSLTLVGLALLLNTQAHKAEKFYGSKLQITAFLCNQNTQSPNCKGDATDQQKQAIQEAIKKRPEVDSYYHQSKQQAFDIWKKIYLSKDVSTNQDIYSSVTPNDMQESYWITLKDPKQFNGVERQLSSMPGVARVKDLGDLLSGFYDIMSALKWGTLGTAVFLLLAAILQVGNAVRLSVMARRREIGIMRLVGASNAYIAIPFLMEVLVAATLGVLLAAIAIAVFMQFAVYDELRKRPIMEWVGWGDAGLAIVAVAVLGLVLTTLSTLVTTRRYLKV